MVCATPHANEKTVKRVKAESRASFLPKMSLSRAKMMRKPSRKVSRMVSRVQGWVYESMPCTGGGFDLSGSGGELPVYVKR